VRLNKSAFEIWGLASILTIAVAILVTDTTTADTIGPLDGVLCDVVATEEVFNPAPECGFNDLGAPILGEYTKEDRKCKNYSHGDELSSWNDTKAYIQGLSQSLDA
jgi:hypothetical protein